VVNAWRVERPVIVGRDPIMTDEQIAEILSALQLEIERLSADIATVVAFISVLQAGIESSPMGQMLMRG